MRQSKFTETQIVSILKEADAGRPVNEIWRTYGLSSADLLHGLCSLMKGSPAVLLSLFS